jgi:flagella basal body P-ring formation protein FlgA
MQRRTRIARLAPQFLLAIGLAAHAQAPIQDLEAIRATALGFAEEQAQAIVDGEPSVQVGGLDGRLRLVRCDQGLEAFLPPGARLPGSATIGVRCLGPTPWTVYLTAQIKVLAEVVVARRYLARGAVIGADDLELRALDLGSIAGGYFIDPTLVAGLELRRALAPGAVVAPAQVSPIMSVRRGDQVQILLRAGGLEVSSTGKALGNGAIGERIQVRNLKSRKVVEGQVEGPGLVSVSL